jgi:hypothetical protein
MNTVLREGAPAGNLLLSALLASSWSLPDEALERMAAQVPVIAEELANGRDEVRLNQVYEVLAQHPLAGDLRNGTTILTAYKRLRRAVEYLVVDPPSYIAKGSAVPLALPWTLTRGSGSGRPLVLRREPAELVEWLHMSEIAARAERRRELRRRAQEPRRPLEPLPFMAKPFEPEEEFTTP